MRAAGRVRAGPPLEADGVALRLLLGPLHRHRQDGALCPGPGRLPRQIARSGDSGQQRQLAYAYLSTVDFLVWSVGGLLGWQVEWLTRITLGG